jgi:hypothetical protein
MLRRPIASFCIASFRSFAALNLPAALAVLDLLTEEATDTPVLISAAVVPHAAAVIPAYVAAVAATVAPAAVVVAAAPAV